MNKRKTLSGGADSRETTSPFGVLDFLPWDHEWNEFHYQGKKALKAIRSMREAGVGIVRVDFLWDDIEHERSHLNFSKYDRLLDWLGRFGIRVLGLLCYSAGWAALHWNDPPPDDLFLWYVSKVVRRYRDRVKYWEVWNEPNEKIYWSGELERYVTLLQKTYTTLKKEDPGSKVLIGGLSQNAGAKLEEAYRCGASGFFDIVNLHPFSSPLQDGIVLTRSMYDDARRAMLAQNEGHKEIWFTEIGCPGLRPGEVRDPWWMGDSPSEEAQARWVETVYREALQWPGVEKIFWAFFRDTPNHFKNGIDRFGLLRNDFSKKPSFYAYQKISRAWQRGRLFKGMGSQA